jgi:hypothetical protein
MRNQHDSGGSSVTARARREAARAAGEAIDHALLSSTPADVERALEVLQEHEAPSAADRVRLRAKRLAKTHESQRNSLLDAADALVLALYRRGMPGRWLCGWCDASVGPDRPPHRAGVGAILLDARGRETARISSPIAGCEPFEAEIAALEAVLDAVPPRDGATRRIRVYTDCVALVKLWLQQRRDPRLRIVRELARRFRRFELRSVPRRHNGIAHRLARDAMLASRAPP